MAEEKDRTQETEEPTEQADNQAAPDTDQEDTKPAPEPAHGNNEVAKRRGRMLAAGLIAAVVLCVIAVGVAAIFSFTADWFDQCPEDIAVNDPAPVLWNKVVTQKSIDAGKGLPEGLKKYGSIKKADSSE
jgi:hypothetical protein